VVEGQEDAYASEEPDDYGDTSHLRYFWMVGLVEVLPYDASSLQSGNQPGQDDEGHCGCQSEPDNETYLDGRSRTFSGDCLFV
jgi:hypothetical protein